MWEEGTNYQGGEEDNTNDRGGGRRWNKLPVGGGEEDGTNDGGREEDGMNDRRGGGRSKLPVWGDGTNVPGGRKTERTTLG